MCAGSEKRLAKAKKKVVQGYVCYKKNIEKKRKRNSSRKIRETESDETLYSGSYRVLGVKPMSFAARAKKRLE